MAEKMCTNVACGMHEKTITTDKNNCMSCNRPLSNSSLVNSIFGESFARDFLGMSSSGDRTTLPSEVTAVLRDAEQVVDRIANVRGKTTRRELRGLLLQIRKVLDEYA